MTSRANHRTAGEATRKRAKASCRQKRGSVCAGDTGTQRKASDPPTLGPPTLLNHILCPDATSPSPSSLRRQSKMGDAQSVGPGREGGGPASKVKGILFVLSGTLAHTFHPSLLPESCPGSIGWKSPGVGYPERTQQLTPQQLQPQAKVGLTPPTRPSGGARCPQDGAAGGPWLRGGTRWGGCSPVSSLYTRVTSVPKGSLLSGRSVTQLCPGHMVRQAWERGR